jgi:hypothetical protein
MTRVHYTYDGLVYTTKPILAGDDTVTVTIDAKNGKYVIENSSNKVLVSGEGKNFHALKAAAKKDLANMGVVFSAELRSSKNHKIGSLVLNTDESEVS